MIDLPQLPGQLWLTGDVVIDTYLLPIDPGEPIDNYSLISLEGDISDKMRSDTIEMVKHDTYQLELIVLEGQNNITSSIEEATFYIHTEYEKVLLTKRYPDGGLEMSPTAFVGMIESHESGALFGEVKYEFRVRSGNIHKTLNVGNVQVRLTVSRMGL